MGRTLAAQEKKQGPGLYPQNPGEKLGMVGGLCNPRQVDPWNMLASESNLLGKLWAKERSCLKIQGSRVPRQTMTLETDLWHTHT